MGLPSFYFTQPAPANVVSGHVNQRMLIQACKSQFGTTDNGQNNFRVELRLNEYKIYPLGTARAKALTENQIRQCRVYRR